MFAGTGLATITRVNIGPAVVSDVWTMDLSRSGCSSDTIVAAPVIHLRYQGTPAFQSTYLTDMVYIATKYGCGTRRLNRIYALSTDAGATMWAFNETGAVDLDFISSAPAIDPASDTLYATSERTLSGTQNSVWAIDVLTGTLPLGRECREDLGEPCAGGRPDLHCEPRR